MITNPHALASEHPLPIKTPNLSPFDGLLFPKARLTLQSFMEEFDSRPLTLSNIQDSLSKALDNGRLGRKYAEVMLKIAWDQFKNCDDQAKEAIIPSKLPISGFTEFCNLLLLGPEIDMIDEKFPIFFHESLDQIYRCAEELLSPKKTNESAYEMAGSLYSNLAEYYTFINKDSGPNWITHRLKTYLRSISKVRGSFDLKSPEPV